jgi:outer membrane receptor protein involved in Fe transport
MKNPFRFLFNGILISFLLLTSTNLFAQIKVNGKVTDENREPLYGATVVATRHSQGTTTDSSGNFMLVIDGNEPVNLVISYLGFADEQIEVDKSISNLEVILRPAEHQLGDVVVTSYSKQKESWLGAAGTVEYMDQRAIQQASAPDFYDDIATLKGVQTYNSSLNFSSYNFRGFGAIANERFVQLVDGMDNSAPLLNFPTGNIVGLSGLDVHNVELVPGAASALYGPNAFNGILIMNSKNPFDYQGLSVESKTGFTSSDAGGSDPYYQITARYAKAFNDRFAFKLNASWLKGTDWRANDYNTGRRTLANQNPSGFGAPDFDGLNTYGDETQIIVPMAAVSVPISESLAPILVAQGYFPNNETAKAALQAIIPTMPTLDIRRTGFQEEELLEDMEVKSIKLDGALHYRLNDNLEASYSYRFGIGSTVYQGGERYVLRDFNQQFHKLELISPDFYARTYITATDAGDSYNLSALGAFANERFSPSSTQWVPNYAGNYVGALLPFYLTGMNPTEEDIANANLAGRQAADATIPQPGSSEFNSVVDQVRKDLFQRNPPGAGFVDDSRLYHAEFGYNFPSLQNFFDFQVGGNYRQYNLFSDGTVFNEDPEGSGKNDRVKINEYGFYGQLVKKLIDDRLKLSGSVRYDKNENFAGQFSPRIAAVYSAGKNGNHNFRASFQTGFRNPSTQQQFIFFPTGVGILLGSTQANAERYGIHNGGAYTNASYNAFLGSILQGMPDANLLEEIDISYVKPEQVQVYELGYKAILDRKVVIDANAYFNTYEDFISQRTVRAKTGTSHQGMPLPGVQDMLGGTASSATAFRPYVNASESITSFGLGLGLSYKFFKEYTAYGHYNYSTFQVDNPGPGFESGFNMPENKFLIGIRNPSVINNLGFDLSYRWQDEFLWENSFAHDVLPAYGVLNAQINYTEKLLNITIKLGGTNILGSDYRTNAGGPFVGSMYYISLAFNI